MAQLIQNGDVLSGTSNDSANILYSEPDGSSKNVQEKIGELDNEVEELNNNLSNINVYVGEDEKLHFVDSAGADTVIPFSSGFSKLSTIITKNSWDWGSQTRTINHTVTLPVGYEYFIVYAYSYGGQSASVPTLSGRGLLSSQASQPTKSGTRVGLYKKNKTETLNVTTSATMTSGNTDTQDLVIIAVPLA